MTLAEKILFWTSVITTIGLSYYAVHQYLKVVEYEKQVNRGWNDLINRADKIIDELKEIRSEFEVKKIGKSKIK